MIRRAILVIMAWITVWFFSPHVIPRLPSLEEDSAEKVPASKLPAVVTIATNGFDPRPLVSSLRGAGQFRGKIYVFGDSCTPSLGADEAVLLNVADLRLSSSSSSSSSSLSSSNDARQAAKHIKQAIFEYLPADTQTALYLDGDIVVNYDVARFFMEARTTSAGTSAGTPPSSSSPWDPECSAYLFRERASVRSIWNAGAMLLDRTYSAPFLKAWTAEIRRHPEFNRDQLAAALALAVDPDTREARYGNYGGEQQGQGQHEQQDNDDNDGNDDNDDNGDDADADNNRNRRAQRDDSDGQRGDARRFFKVCDLPEGHNSFAYDTLTYLRGARSTTFTHWTKLKASKGSDDAGLLWSMLQGRLRGWSMTTTPTSDNIGGAAGC